MPDSYFKSTTSMSDYTAHLFHRGANGYVQDLGGTVLGTNGSRDVIRRGMARGLWHILRELLNMVFGAARLRDQCVNHQEFVLLK